MNHLTLEERKKIEALLKNGYNINWIARSISRHYNTIYNEIRKNGGIDLYNAEKAHACAFCSLKLRNTQPNFEIDDNAENSVSHRLDCLEMQIEILSETIKELLRK